MNANPEELHKQELLKFQALRAEQDLKAAALKTGQDLGEVKLQQGPPRKLPPMATNVTDSEAFENSVNNSRVADLVKQRELALAQEATSRRRRQQFHTELNYPHTLAEKRFLKLGGQFGMMGGNMVGAGAVVLLTDNVQALQDPVAMAALQGIFGTGFKYVGQQTGEKLAADLVKAKRVVQESVTPEYHNKDPWQLAMDNIGSM